MSNELTVFLTGEVDAARMAAVRAAAPAATFRHFSNSDEMERDIAAAEVLAGTISAAALPAAKRLKWVQSWSAGPDKQLYPEFVASPIPLTCCKGNGAVPLAEHAMMLMLMLNRNMLRWQHAQRDRGFAIFVDNLRRYVAGETLLNIVDKRLGY